MFPSWSNRISRGIDAGSLGLQLQSRHNIKKDASGDFIMLRMFSICAQRPGLGDVAIFRVT